MLNDSDLLRYSRHILLPEWDIAAQKRLQAAHVLIVGMGGLGSAAAFYLAAAGVGTLTIFDDDLVSFDNLQRQILHTTERVGAAKNISASMSLQALNPNITLHVKKRADRATLQAELACVDMLVDCSDNFATRLVLNELAIATATPLMVGAASTFSGQLFMVNPRHRKSFCYECLFELTPSARAACHASGVIGPLVGMIGSAQALEVLKYLTNIGSGLEGFLLTFDAKTHNWKRFVVAPDPACEICAPRKK